MQVRTEGFENGLKVIFFIKEKPLIREITFEGNDELTTEKLKEDPDAASPNRVQRAAYQ